MSGSALTPWSTRALAIALLASLVAWNLPMAGIVLYPFKILGTWVHEGSHALVMLLTGAGLDRIAIYADGSGFAFAEHPVGAAARAAIASAGYMGTPVFGALLLWRATDARRARLGLTATAALMGVSALLVVANPFGQVALSLLAATVLGVVAFAPARAIIAGAQLLGVQACLLALLDVRVLFRPAQIVDGVPLAASDAHVMGAITFGTSAQWAATVWAVVWLAWACAITFVALRHLARVQRGVAPSSEVTSPGHKLGKSDVGA